MAPTLANYQTLPLNRKVGEVQILRRGIIEVEFEKRGKEKPLSKIILYNWSVARQDRKRQFLIISLAISLAERVPKITPESVISAVSSTSRDIQAHAVLAPIAV
jgi:hypothetical protein